MDHPGAGNPLSYNCFSIKNAEREGFEPSVGVTYTRLAGAHLQPLGHLSCHIQFKVQKLFKEQKTTITEL